MVTSAARIAGSGVMGTATRKTTQTGMRGRMTATATVAPGVEAAAAPVGGEAKGAQMEAAGRRLVRERRAAGGGVGRGMLYLSGDFVFCG